MTFWQRSKKKEERKKVKLYRNHWHKWIICLFLGAHVFFMTQPKSAVKKNSILINTRRSAATSRPPPRCYPFTQTSHLNFFGGVGGNGSGGWGGGGSGSGG
jgi:hypothetical protein